MKELPEGIRCRKVQCPSCVFRPESEGGVHLTPARHAEIRQLLLTGGNQRCHHDQNRTICRGGRDFQLEIWAALGLLDAPTDEALRRAMRAAGVAPRPHI
jgi:hypothetical protein